MTNAAFTTPHARYHLTLVDQHLATNDPLIGLSTIAMAFAALVGLLSMAAALL